MGASTPGSASSGGGNAGIRAGVVGQITELILGLSSVVFWGLHNREKPSMKLGIEASNWKKNLS